MIQAILLRRRFFWSRLNFADIISFRKKRLFNISDPSDVPQTFAYNLNLVYMEWRIHLLSHLLRFNAILQVAILCNHQRAVPKGHEDQMNRLNDKLLSCREELAELELELKVVRGKADAKKLKEPSKKLGNEEGWAPVHLYITHHA